MQARIESLTETMLVGMKIRMSFAGNRTAELWRSFMPRRGEIENVAGNELYSAEVYPGTEFMSSFDPANEFEKWAAVRVGAVATIPEGMDTLLLPPGKYAVFHYKGKPSEAAATYRYIYMEWLPQSGYRLANRPHFALMGEKYKGEDPRSEEELWIPVE